ncbi:MAG TPA: hypothetical protein VIC08_06160 [Cellvibrionaceae bacterium]
MSYSNRRPSRPHVLFSFAPLCAKTARVLTALLGVVLLLVQAGCARHDNSDRALVAGEPIDRQALVARHNPQLAVLDPNSPFTVGNGQFAFTADITGFQSFPEHYFTHGIPLETKARWAWHSRQNPDNYQLDDASETYQAYQREVSFPTDMDSAAGQWLRQNPHDLPLMQIALNYDEKPLVQEQVSEVRQQLDLWNGLLTSQFHLHDSAVSVQTTVADGADTLAFELRSDLVDQQQLSIAFAFPRGYDPEVKNTPAMLWDDHESHHTKLEYSDESSALFSREVDDARHWVMLHWQGKARLEETGEHRYRLQLRAADVVSASFSLAVQFSQEKLLPENQNAFAPIAESAQTAWQAFWHSGAAIDFSGSQAPQARELERRVVLSQYVLAVQSRGDVPAQETGLTSSSWYGKFHTEMIWWHQAHWALWNRAAYTEQALSWYLKHLGVAKATAKNRGLEGARWSKMIGPDGRESPGGNPLIIWNQPLPILLAERVYERQTTADVVERYAELVDDSARALSSMLTWEEEQQRYSLNPPIWIAQEHYEVTESKNPSFELGLWYTGLQTAQQWRERLGQAPHPLWQKQIEKLAALPQKDGKYVAIESIPDTFDNLDSRNDHPAMLGVWGLIKDDRVDPDVMRQTLFAVMDSWDFEERIWGWDYPMIAMTANRLNEPEIAVEALLMDAHNNHYNINGHCPQKKVGLPVYLPANGALLAAVAYMATTNTDSETLGFPDNGQWQVRAEGF